MIKPPSFWNDPEASSHPVAILLSPISAVYNWATQNKLKKATGYKSSLPVICIGNASMGGVGKTPFSIFLSTQLKEIGAKPAFLTRGYGGSEEGPLWVVQDALASEVGDEPLLLRDHSAVCVSAKRDLGAQFIEQGREHNIIIMDDGMQNPSLQKQFTFMLVDAEIGFGNGRVFPSGPLREKPQSALSRTDAVVFVVPHADYEVDKKLLKEVVEKPVFKVWLEPAEALQSDQEYLAFSGIGRPQKFYDTARRAGYKIKEMRDFPDHHAYTASDLDSLLNWAREQGAPLLTTEKDYCRLPEGFKPHVKTLPVVMKVDQPQRLCKILEPIIRK